MSDLDLEVIKALDLDSYFDALLREWYDGVVQRGDGTALREDLESRGLDIDALVAEVERLRKQRGVAEMLATRAWQLWAGLPTELQESEAGQRFIGAFGGFSAYFEERGDD